MDGRDRNEGENSGGGSELWCRWVSRMARECSAVDWKGGNAATLWGDGRQTEGGVR